MTAIPIEVTSEELTIVLAALDNTARRCEEWVGLGIDAAENQRAANEARLLADRLCTRFDAGRAAATAATPAEEALPVGGGHRVHHDGLGPIDLPWKSWCQDCDWGQLHTTEVDALTAADQHRRETR